MKNKVKIVSLIVLTVIITTFVLCGCDLARKLKGAEVSFPTKIAEAKAFSFDMDITCVDKNGTSTVSMRCYKRENEDGDDEYAYDFFNKNAVSVINTYRNLYADDRLYEVLNPDLGVGSYYVKESVSVTSDDNVLYVITENILIATVATFLTSAHKEELNGENVYRYDIEVNDKNISIWYNDVSLVKIAAELQDENGDKAKYDILLGNYKFDEEMTDNPFVRPNELPGIYAEQPFDYEDWAKVVNNFATYLNLAA